jgi:hypothetical protein
MRMRQMHDAANCLLLPTVHNRNQRTNALLCRLALFVIISLSLVAGCVDDGLDPAQIDLLKKGYLCCEKPGLGPQCMEGWRCVTNTKLTIPLECLEGTTFKFNYEDCHPCGISKWSPSGEDSGASCGICVEKDKVADATKVTHVVQRRDWADFCFSEDDMVPQTEDIGSDPPKEAESTN